MNGPLTGLRVLDIATIIAAPSAAALLADYGASVVKAELPGAGDGMRDFPPHKDGKPLWWKVTNRGKRLITLDLRKPEGAALLLRMLPQFDVLIENFRPGTLDRWGLTKEALWQAQPSLVILRTTGFGQSGPYRDRPGFARLFEAMGGLTYISGEAQGAPMHCGYPLADNVGGLFGAVGVLAALWRRARNPQAPGEEIDLSLTEATLKLLEFLPIQHEQLGTVYQRSGNANQYSAPAAVYRTADGQWVSLSGSTNAMFANNCRAIGRPELIDEPCFANNRGRVLRHRPDRGRPAHARSPGPLRRARPGLRQRAHGQCRAALCPIARRHPPRRRFAGTGQRSVLPGRAGNACRRTGPPARGRRHLRQI